MADKIQVFRNEKLNVEIKTMLNEDGSISVNAEDTAIGYGWCRTETKNGKEYHSVMWSRMNGYLRESGFAHECAKDDYIPESLYYLLGMKASNRRAQQFQRWLAMDVIPEIRKTGYYSMEPDSEPDNMISPELYIEAARIMATQPDSRDYVTNILRHVVGDIDVGIFKAKPKDGKPYWKEGVDIDVPKLKAAMRAKRISRTELAARAGVAEQTVDNWLSGKNRPVIENRDKICAALGEGKNYLTPRQG